MVVTLRVRLASGKLLVLDDLEPQMLLADVEAKLQRQLDLQMPPFHHVRLLRPRLPICRRHSRKSAPTSSDGSEASVADLVQWAVGTEIAAIVGLDVVMVESALQQFSEKCKSLKEEDLSKGRRLGKGQGKGKIWERWEYKGHSRSSWIAENMRLVESLFKAVDELGETGRLDSSMFELLLAIAQCFLLTIQTKPDPLQIISDLLLKHGDVATADKIHGMIHTEFRRDLPVALPARTRLEEVAHKIQQRHQSNPTWQRDAFQTCTPASNPPADEEAPAPAHDRREGSTEEEVAAALQREGADVQEALLRSKAEPRSADGVLVARVTFHSSEIAARILGSSSLADAIERVADAGCDLQPKWAHGAILLVPLTEEHLREAGVILQAHNIVFLQTDHSRVEEALRGLPRRKRPMLKPECRDQDPSQNSPGASAPVAKPNIDGEVPFPELVVEKTFLGFPMSSKLRELSSKSSVTQSDPGAGAACSRHPNPRRWA